MGQTLSEPMTSKESSSCANEKYKVGSSCMQGWRVSMEDAHTHLLSLQEDNEAAFFAVYDGHGGSAVSKYAGMHLHRYVVQHPSYKDGDIETAIREGFLEFDNAMLGDEKMRREVAGSTAVIVLIKGNKLYCGNAGDSRAIACVSGECHPLSFDHKPSNPQEEARIRSAGGWVEYNRVNGNLALSRALGDFAFKRNSKKLPQEQMVTALPDVEKRTITDDWEFILIACDGIWDVVTNEEACAFVRYSLGAGIEPEKICEDLMTACLAPDCQMGGLGCDNMTVILISMLHGQPWLKYCSKIAKTLEPRVSGYDTHIARLAMIESSDDDDDVIPVERLPDANSIGACLTASLSAKSRTIPEEDMASGEPEKTVDSELFQDVIQAQDYVHKESTIGKVKSVTVTAPVAVTPADPNIPNPMTMNELVSVLDEDVLPHVQNNQQQEQPPPPPSSSGNQASQKKRSSQ